MRPARSEDRRGSQYRLAKPGRRKLSVGEHELVGKVGRKGFAFVGLDEATGGGTGAPTRATPSTQGAPAGPANCATASARRTPPPSRSFPNRSVLSVA